MHKTENENKKMPTKCHKNSFHAETRGEQKKTVNT